MERQNKVKKGKSKFANIGLILQKCSKIAIMIVLCHVQKIFTNIHYPLLDTVFHFVPIHGKVTSHKDEHYSHHSHYRHYSDYTKAASVARAGASLQPAFSK